MDTWRGGAAVITLTTNDSELLDRVLSVTAAVGIDPLVLADPGALRPHWATAAMVLVGADQAERVAATAPTRRAEVYLLADDDSPDEAYRWSVPLGAAVLTLPSAASWLAAALADHSGAAVGSGGLIGVVSGSGGVGGSTLAAALGYVAARVWPSVMLVDADPWGGGLDLLLGAERIEGWRWDRLGSARGHLGDLTGQLPRVDGVDVLAIPRGESPAGWAPGAEQLAAVLASAGRSHELTVVDAPRSLAADCWSLLEPADRLIVVVRGDVRGVAAARELLRSADLSRARTGVVVRHGRTRVLAAETVAEGLGLELFGVMLDEQALVLGADRGEPPARSARSPLARLCRDLLAGVTADRAETAGVG